MLVCHSGEEFNDDEESCMCDSLASHLRSFADAQDDISAPIDSSLSLRMTS